MPLIQSKLVLKNGKEFNGFSPSYQRGIFFGEVVFNTGMTGYVETLTDPSYAGQILTFTYPLIGNYGVPGAKAWESKKIHVRGVIVSEACENWSHQEGQLSLLDWLRKQNIPIVTDIDTRALTKLLRDHGVMLGAIKNPGGARRASQTGGQARTINQLEFSDPNEENLAAIASIKKKKIYGNGKKKIIAVDCGMKENIIRSLAKFPVTIMRVPYNYDYTAEQFDGIFLSNGPGDPKMALETITILKKALKYKKPVFGICLGSQIMGLASGATTYKLPFGHRGQNQPCQNVRDGRCYITSQNHGYAVAEKSLLGDWYVNFRNLNDGTIEGIAHKKLPFFSVQFHPEASPGPTDTRILFEEFFKLL
ncbi:MAG: carbamoyl phosphate synthase small subunit [Candidatus Doudnabacteria bacterium RIFCSPHIGHO2_01_FULL_43_23]|uniref:Carbamoyl phosphate synthase small chain n=1 Tax=Candidatus Doudnabacteria bacterium RIFCSPHIGHO2_01_FULL_43_23 TaxID=1817822 RepID=A0A1F5NUU3_9BACT|nr:MAG: carbamoyl phosphate synthase small subunit [Candidatus Doudnabacteria bacterium RIFCSPHIGHO2_01_FULL_43_23]